MALSRLSESDLALTRARTTRGRLLAIGVAVLSAVVAYHAGRAYLRATFQPTSAHLPSHVERHAVLIRLPLVLPFAVYFVLSPILDRMIGGKMMLRRHRQGRCIACGYDLSGRPEGGCPECGRGAGEAGA